MAHRLLNDLLWGFCMLEQVPIVWSVNGLMKRVIVQILPADGPASARSLESFDEIHARQEVIPIDGIDHRSSGTGLNEHGQNESGPVADSGIRVEAVVSAERARTIVDTVLNVNELTDVDSFERMIELLIQRELASDDSGQLFHRVMSTVEKTLVEKAFIECGQVQTRTAERLGVNRNTIHKKLVKHELLDPDDEEIEAAEEEHIEKRRCD
jgi:DNA-binding protein Fis